MNTRAVEPRPARKPQCDRRKAGEDGAARRCLNDGLACWVKGDFGRSPMNLCNDCRKALILIGWDVRYQDDKYNPPPLQSEITGKG
jgi:hypothetical protein